MMGEDIKEGWISVHRKIKRHWVWDDPIYLKAWLTIIMQVNHEDAKVLIKGTLYECKRGQSLMSLQGWMKLFNERVKRRRAPVWTVKKVRTFFRLLQKDGMIVHRGVSKTTRLTVCNYDVYQGGGQLEGNLRATSGQQTIRNNNDNKYGRAKIEINEPGPDAR